MADTSKITLGQLKTALTQAKNYTDNEIAGVAGVSKVEPEELDMPKVFFYGNALPTTKDNVNLTMDYISNTTKFSSFVKLKCQGTSSMSYAKKNFTVSMFSDEARATKLKKDFKGWGAQSKFCLKANYVDTTHTRNLSGARIGCDMVASRPDSAFKQQLLTAPRYGLVDGFPIKLYFNGEFYGIYTWNISKDGWMFNMDSGNPNHIVLCAEKNTNGNSSAINSCQFRQLWDGGADWSYEFGTPSNTVKDSLNRCIGFVMNATDQEFHDNIGQYFDLYSLLDYYCFSYLTCHLDGLAKNLLMVTYDGVIWGASLYDMDSIYGVSWNGNSYVTTNYQCPEQYQEQFSRLWVRIEQCFATELYARYLELRQGALSLSNIVKHVEEIYDIIPDRVFADEKAKWTSLPNVNTNTMTRFRNYMRDRAVYVDAQMREIGTKVPCTGITLSANNLSFTATDTQTLTVTVQPTNTTDVVTWSVSPTGVVTVNNGVVTPIANGNCTITATCGTQTATCTVNVALPVVECTSISLDRDTLTLSGSGGSSNLLTGVPNSVVSKNVVFDAITLQPGIYKFTNIDGGSFTYLGYTINSGAKQEPNKNSTNPLLFELTETSSVVLNAFSNNVATNTSEKLGLYKTTKGQETQFTVAGDGYYESANKIATSSNDKYIDTVALDANKCYVLKYNGTPTLANRNICMVINGVLSYSSGQINTGDTVKLIYNASSLTLSCNISRGNTIDDLVLYEAEALDTETTSSYQLIATVTPSNCTQPVVWSVSPEGIVTVDNGLVTAVANGEATVTATCGTQSATCAVTVSGMSESGGDTLTTM